MRKNCVDSFRKGFREKIIKEKYKEKAKLWIDHILRYRELLGLVLEGMIHGKQLQKKITVILHKPDYRRLNNLVVSQ